jgi:hypothetical protein
MPSNKAMSAQTNWGGIVVVLLAGLLMTWLGGFNAYEETIGPALSILAARSWNPVPCTILTNSVQPQPDTRESKTFVIAVSYSYLVNGTSYRSNRYSFLTEPSSAFGWRAAVVKNLPPGRTTTCYVDPHDPSQAVIDRDWNSEMWWGLESLGLFGFGVFLLGAAVWWIVAGWCLGQNFKAVRQESLSRDRLPSRPASIPAGRAGAVEGPTTLVAETSPLAARNKSLMAAVGWNLIVVCVAYTRTAWRTPGAIGRDDYLVFGTLIPFAMFGVFLLARFVGRALAVAYPLPVLTLSQSRVPLGTKVKLSWSFEGGPNAVESLSIRVKGREKILNSARIRTWEDYLFHDQIVLERSKSDQIVGGEVDLVIPASSMHSFETKQNAIAWQLSLVGRAPWRPAVRADFPIRVAPHE